jgi:hypothetical protein
MAGTVLSYREHYQASGDIYWARICVAAAQHIVCLLSFTITYRLNFLYISVEKMQTLISSCNPFMSKLQVTSEWDVCFPLYVTRQHTVNRGTYGADMIWGKIKWEICFPLPTEGFK